MNLSDIAVTIEPSLNTERGGINLSLDMANAPASAISSPIWTVAGWSLQFVQLPAHTRIDLPSQSATYVKVITGALTQPERCAYAAPFEVRSTQVTGTIESGPQSALIALFTESDQAPEILKSMEDIVFAGAHSQALPFQQFHEKFSAFTDAFKGADAYMSPGIHLLDENAGEIANVIFWTAGKGVSLTTHNHGQDPSPLAPAFAEVHWVIRNGTGNGGMYLADTADAPAKQNFPMQTGEEHGPFFHLNPSNSRPKQRDNGAVDYPWHGWCGGTDSQPGQAYDFVCAFEITTEYAEII